MKNLFYVNGGGLGHLSRISAFIYTLRLEIKECYILSASSYSYLFFSKENIINIPKKLAFDELALPEFIQKIVNNNNIENLYIDTFPLGILKELQFINLQKIKTHYISRYLKWDIYKNDLKKHIIFDKIYLFEKLQQEHSEFITHNKSKRIHLTLNYNTQKPNNKTLEILNPLPEKWLIVHSTPKDEVISLLEYAKDIARVKKKNPMFIIISQKHFKVNSNCIFLNYFPAYNLFPYVDKIVTACGFNSMQQTKNFRKKHIYIPFPRKFDDQFWRSKQKI